MEKIVYILAISFYGFGNLNGFLPLTITMILIFFLFFLNLYKITIQKKILKVKMYILLLLIVIISSFILNIQELTPKEIFLNLKFIIYFIIYFIVSFYLLRKNKIYNFIKVYILFGVLISIIAIIQYILALLGIDIGISNSKSTIRATSIASEPSQLGMYLLPLIYLSIARILKIKTSFQYMNFKRSLLVLIASILTFSLIVYIYIFTILIFLLFRYKNILKTSLTLMFIVLFGFFLIPKINSIDNRLKGLTDTTSLLASDNLSIIAVYSNYLILEKTFEKYWFLGSGISTHPRKYNLYILDFYSKSFELNKNDASSMPLRILSELGIIGFFIFYLIICIYIFKIKSSKDTFLQEMFLLSFLLYGIRYGSINTPMFWIFLSGFLNLFKSIRFRPTGEGVLFPRKFKVKGK